jgi:hypothetical protein
MNNPDHISDSLETIFGLKYLNSLMRIRDLGSGMEKFGSGIRDKHPGSAILLPTLSFLCKKFGKIVEKLDNVFSTS